MSVCRKHGGAGPQVQAAAERRVAEAEVAEAARTYGVPVKVGLMDGLPAEWHRVNGHVAWLGARIAEMEAGALTGEDAKGTQQAHALVTLYESGRKHLAKLGVDLIRVGFEERQLKATETQQPALVNAIVAPMRDLGLGDRVSDLWRAVQSQLGA